MKASELMVGDWVLINGVPRKIEAVDGVDNEIMADDEIYCLAEDRYHSEDKVIGIPLTPEILEKNGFKLEKVPDSRWFHAQMERMIITLYRFDTFYSIMINTDSHLPVLNNIQLHSVHELQHVLRLCEIEKEIVL